jgi:hypothetical protein
MEENDFTKLQQVISKSLLLSLSNVKKELGKDCTFLAFSKESSKNKETGEVEEYDAFNALIINDLGGKDRVIYRIDKPLYTLEEQDFTWLKDALKNKMYE